MVPPLAPTIRTWPSMYSYQTSHPHSRIRITCVGHLYMRNLWIYYSNSYVIPKRALRFFNNLPAGEDAADKVYKNIIINTYPTLLYIQYFNNKLRYYEGNILYIGKYQSLIECAIHFISFDLNFLNSGASLSNLYNIESFI